MKQVPEFDSLATRRLLEDTRDLRGEFVAPYYLFQSGAPLRLCRISANLTRFEVEMVDMTTVYVVVKSVTAQDIGAA